MKKNSAGSLKTGAGSMIKPHAKRSSRTIITALDQLRQNFKKTLRSHRAHLYALMGAVAEIKIQLDRSRQLRSKVVLLIRKRREESGISNPKGKNRFNLLTELMAVATGANSVGARKLAFKRGRVVDVLLTSGVGPAKITAEIKARGGIERVYSDSVRNSENVVNKARPRTKVSPSTPLRSSSANDYDTTLSMKIRASDREDVAKLGLGCRIRLSALRVGDGPDDIKITKVRILKPEAHQKPDAEAEDWD
jgi:hypothetical protein